MGPLMRTDIEYTFKRLTKLSMYVTNGSWNIDNNGVDVISAIKYITAQAWEKSVDQSLYHSGFWSEAS